MEKCGGTQRRDKNESGKHIFVLVFHLFITHLFCKTPDKAYLCCVKSRSTDITKHLYNFVIEIFSFQKVP